MDRRSKIIIGIFIAVLTGIIIMEIIRPKPINWRPSYTATDKIPFGCYVLFNELPGLFPDNTIKPIDKSAYETLAYRDRDDQSSFIFINNGIDFDQEETRELLDYVNDGNDVFIASTYFGHLLSDTLNLQMQSSYTVKEDTITTFLTNTTFPKAKFLYTRGLYKTHFTSVDTLNTTVLGYLNYSVKNSLLQNDPEDIEYFSKPNFVKVGFGKGSFYLNSTPQAYTNYYMLRGNEDYVAHTFSYLSDKPIVYWDNYKKSGRVIIDSPMRFVLNQTALKWAYYLSMSGLLVFFIFKAKRQQRVIPIIDPLENSSVEFARTVGSLYYQHKDYTDLIAKKLKYFMEYVRSHYYLDTNTINEKMAIDLAAKSGKSKTETKALIDFIGYLKNKTVHTEQDIIQLNKKITLFKQ
ncbi:MAG: DUF4350 domain-containing protein [Bacteroidota bacterium]